MKYTVAERQNGHDNANLYLNGKFIGFVSKDGTVGLQDCPECGRENHAGSVVSGRCAWCGFVVGYEIKEQA